MSEIKKLGIIAGKGQLPQELVQYCSLQGIEPYIVALTGFTDETVVQDHAHVWVKLGQVGKIMSFFRSHGVKDLVLIGAVKRPSWSEIRPDLKAIKIISRIGFTVKGDNSLLVALKKELEKDGFTLHGIQNFIPGLLCDEGAIGKYSFSKDQASSVQVGLQASKTLGALDIGQSVVVQDNIVLAVEGVEGTDALIKRSADLQKKGAGAILVKAAKPQQDKSLDLPTIGISTVENAREAGFSGVVVEAGNVLISDRKAVAEYANRYKMFVQGVVFENDA